MKAITVKELTKKYKEHVAVDHLSFEVEEGELFAFLGENGAGKSTTINILCTILEKNAGDIEILGHELGREDDKIRDDIGIVFQNSVLDAKLTVKEKSHIGYVVSAYFSDFKGPCTMVCSPLDTDTIIGYPSYDSGASCRE